MKTIGVRVVSASASGFAMAAIAQGKLPDESALRSGARFAASEFLNQPLSDEVDAVAEVNDEEE